MSDVDRRILIVEDDPLVLTGLADGLETSGYTVATAISGERALALFNDFGPDLVLMDICLPGLSGVEAARRLRQISDVPVVFLTALNQDAATREAIETGAHVYLVKPVTLGQLVPIVESALARSADLGRLRERGDNLATALRQSRDVSVAIGMLMERYGLSAEQAFERLRKHARATRRTTTTVAADLVAGKLALGNEWPAR